jgi:hypothetical protein
MKLLKATWWEALAVASALTLSAMQYVHNAGEGFFWFNGAMYYTGFYSFTLLFFGVIASMTARERASVPGMLGAVPLAAVLGG